MRVKVGMVAFPVVGFNPVMEAGIVVALQVITAPFVGEVIFTVLLAP